jgi:hypothetical protein
MGFVNMEATGNVLTITTCFQNDCAEVTEGGVVQKPTSDYTVSSTTLTFGTAPATGVAIQIRELPR